MEETALLNGVVGEIPERNFYLGDATTLASLTTGQQNIAIGSGALNAATDGSFNTAIGFDSGGSIIGGGNNALLGAYTGSSLTSGGDNVAVGVSAGAGLIDGDYNVMVGRNAGTGVTTGSGNVMLGNSAGYDHATESDILIIDNEERANKAAEISTALLYGYFEHHVNGPALTINGALTVNGTIASGEHTITNDGAGLCALHMINATDNARFILHRGGGSSGARMWGVGAGASSDYTELDAGGNPFIWKEQTQAKILNCDASDAVELMRLTTGGVLKLIGRLEVPNSGNIGTATTPEAIRIEEDGTIHFLEDVFAGGDVDVTGDIDAANYTAVNLLTACATNAGELDFSAASKKLTVENNAIVSQDYTSDASPTFANLDLGTGELTAGSINRASGTLLLEIGGTAELSIATDLVTAKKDLTVNGELTMPGLFDAGITDTSIINFGQSAILTFLEFAGNGAGASGIKVSGPGGNELTLAVTAAEAGFTTAKVLTFASTGESLSFAAATVGKSITFTSPTIFLKGEVEAGGATTKIKLTSIGGYAIKLTNKTGGNTVAGEVVEADAVNDDAFDTAGNNSEEAIGVILDAGVADGAEAWVVVAGIADVNIGEDADPGDRIIAGAVGGEGDVWNVGGAVATHFLEIGHCIENTGGAGLARCVLHFN